MGHLRKDCYRSVTKMDASSETSPSLNPQECVSDVGKVNTGLTSVDQREIDMHGHPLPWETGLALGPVANNTGYRFPVLSGMGHQQNHQGNIDSALEI